MNKVLKRILWLSVLLIGLSYLVYHSFFFYLRVDEVADCQFSQWKAGGKEPPQLPSGTYQCSETHIAVATCLKDAEGRPRARCLLSFHR